MSTAKKVEYESLPQGYSPKQLPEILKLAKAITGDAAYIYEQQNKLFFMETDRLIIRRFTAEDGEAVLALSLDRGSSSMKNFDEQWPADLEGCKGAASYFAGDDRFFAVCLKPSLKLIGFISYNSVSDDNILDLGHVWHSAYQDNDHDTEALSLMVQYAFEKRGVDGVSAGNPLDKCPEQTAPLKTIGMEVIETRPGAFFVKDEDGNPITFTGCKMLITKEQWEADKPKGYQPKTKPEILQMAEQSKGNQLDEVIHKISFMGAPFEVIRRPDVIWAGCVAYANNNTDPAFADDDLTLIHRFQGLIEVSEINDKINPDWSAALSINYTCENKPSGIMFANEVYTNEQDERYDLLTQPGGLWLRLRNDREAAIALLGKDSASPYEYFGLMRDAAKENGYLPNPNVHIEIEYHCHAEYNTPPHTNYAYIPIVEADKPKGYQPKTKPEILQMAEENGDSSLPLDVKIPYEGKFEQEGQPPYGGHTRAYSSAITSLAMLMGVFHDTRVVFEHGREYTADYNYFLHLLVDGEGFLFWQDCWNYITDELPQTAGENKSVPAWELTSGVPKGVQPLLDSTQIAGIDAEFYSSYSIDGIAGGIESADALRKMVMRNLVDGFPVLLFSGEPGDKIILAIGYQKGGEVLLSWTFSAGGHKQNTTFDSVKCKRLSNWTESIIGALLVKSTPKQTVDKKALLLRALERGETFIRNGATLRAYCEAFKGAGKAPIRPEIWDLAERRYYLGNTLEEMAKLFESAPLLSAANTAKEIHWKMFRIDEISRSKKGKAAQTEISDILAECCRLDTLIADDISAFLADFKKGTR